MLGENFVYFFTVQGFFVGVIFGILKSFDADSLFVYTLFITAFFYLFSHIIIALYYKTLTSKADFFLRSAHEVELDYYAGEINKRDHIVDTACKVTDIAIKMNEESLDGQQ
ncbi:hypothetical protein [Sulfurimonas sp.]|jgi:phage shock protein PspC (stress-responsive transcriptional regulator)|uniref:hypothetical protein n=1 Tax=Sulfurimonas sp. TaxID=2022749 RepID=UPI0025F22592|nr:hypothetical protein [Sulfurimonas sp.]MBT5934320.1 hypothetical protein [Sulfurimonas sp.]